ncbi:MAG: hypothetical protein QOF76_3003 [Solirubrobacteraceae bacterium]|nr:hypothetical protein [Solirubrobacteraceae bacterium]
MRRVLTTASALILGSTAVAAVTAAGGSAAARGRTVTFFEDGRSGAFVFVDNRPHSPVPNADSPKARFSLGDQATFNERLLDHRGGKPVGRVFATETVVAGSRYPRVTDSIHAIFRFADGQIIVDTVVDERHPERVHAAVTGGTGAYEGARGTFTTKPGRTGNADRIELLPG